MSLLESMECINKDAYNKNDTVCILMDGMVEGTTDTKSLDISYGYL